MKSKLLSYFGMNSIISHYSFRHLIKVQRLFPILSLTLIATVLAVTTGLAFTLVGARQASNGAGIVGEPPITSVLFTGTSKAAAIVKATGSPASHITVVGAGCCYTHLILGPSPVSGALSGNSMRLYASGVSAGGAYDRMGNSSLIWTPTKLYFHQMGFSQVSEVTDGVSSISDIQGIVYDPQGNKALIWTPTKLYFHQMGFAQASEVTDGVSSIGNIRGIVYDPQGNKALIWTPTKLYYHQMGFAQASEVTDGVSSIGNIQGLTYDPQGDKALIWTPTKLYFHQMGFAHASEVTDGVSSIGSIQGLAYDPQGDKALIWTPTKLFFHQMSFAQASEVTDPVGASIINIQSITYDPQGDKALLWTTTNLYYHQMGFAQVSEVKNPMGASLIDIQGIVYDPQGDKALLWTTTNLYYHQMGFAQVSEITDGVSSISNIDGVIYDPQGDKALLWNPSKLFFHQMGFAQASEVTDGVSSISSIRGVVYDPQGDQALIWNPSKLYYHQMGFVQASEVTDGVSSISDVEAVVYDPMGDRSLIWTPSKLYMHQMGFAIASEITDGISSIASYNPLAASNVQVVIHHATYLTWVEPPPRPTNPPPKEPKPPGTGPVITPRDPQGGDRVVTTYEMANDNPPNPPWKRRGFPFTYADPWYYQSGSNQVQADPCIYHIDYLWAALNGSTEDYSCGGYPVQPAIPYPNTDGEIFAAEILSPDINWSQDINGVPILAPATGARLECEVYMDNPLDNLVFFEWRVRSRTGYVYGPWVSRHTFYYEEGPGWIPLRLEFGDMITPGATHVQVALGLRDMYDYWGGVYGFGSCHSHAPLITNIEIFRLGTVGPEWHVRNMDLFQDNFPEDGTVTGTTRIDAALDINPMTNPSILPGDSIVVSVSEPNVGLRTHAVYGTPEVSIYVRSTGGQTGASLAGEPGFFPILGTSGGFTQLLMEPCSEDQDRLFFADLNDNLFNPPDRIDYYFSATDDNGNTTYWSRGAGTVTVESKVQAAPMEVQCLPTGNSDILYVNDCEDTEAQTYFDTAFELLGITPDRYDVNSPSSQLGNGPGARVKSYSSQIIDVYQKIIWNSGSLARGTIGDGSGNPEKSDDVQLLVSFLDQSSIWNPGLYITGDDVAEEMKTIGAAFSILFAFIGYDLTNGDHIAEGAATAPLVVGFPPATIFQHAGPPIEVDTMVAFGGCPLINDFDVLVPGGTAITQMYYNDNPITGAAVISQETTNSAGKTARVVLEGFSYHNIRDDRPHFPPDRVDHLLHIIRWFDNPVGDATGTKNEPAFTNNLAQNYPNPFNPETTIKFSLKTKGYVSIRVYNVAGQLVKTLIGEERAAGIYTDVAWHGMNSQGEPVASGVYFYRLVTKGFIQTKKMVMLK